MQNQHPIRNRKPSEEGFMLLVAIFMLALLALSLSIAVPSITKSIQHDREVETMHRGKQYIRAIQLYYRKFGSYPPNINALVNTNNIRFLRKKYTDPMTGKDDWTPILFGQNKAPLALGFFGQPIAGGATPIAGVGPGGVGTSAGSSTAPTGFGGSGLGGSSFGGSGFGGSSLGGASSGSLFSNTNSSNTTTSAGATTGNPTNGTDAAGGATSGTGTTTGTGTGTTSGTSTSALNGQTFGGAGIIGVSVPDTSPSILIYKTKEHFNEWEFVYSPLSELKTIGSGGSSVPGASTGTGQTGGATGFSGSGFGGTGLNGSGFGGSSLGGSGFGGTNTGAPTTGGTNTGSGTTTSPTTPSPQTQ